MMWAKNPNSLPRDAYAGAGKRHFIGLMCASCLLLCLCIAFLWMFPLFDMVRLHPVILYTYVAIGLCCLGSIIGVTLLIIYQIYTGAQWMGRYGARGFVIRLLLPLMELVGRGVGISKSTLRLSFIKINNELVLASKVRCAPQSLLLLLPHCLQRSECPHRLNTDVQRCKRCGGCCMGDLLNLADRLHIQLCVASGGTLARRIVAKLKPRVIVAVACERDLTSGIQDAYPIPVFGCLNMRPHGPCMDTLVDVLSLEVVIKGFLTASENNAPPQPAAQTPQGTQGAA